MRPMAITDAMFLLGEVREKPLHVGALQLFRPPEEHGAEVTRDAYRRAIRHGEVAALLRRYPRHTLGGLGPWGWAEDSEIDLEYHVRHSALPHPGEIRELLALVSRLHGTLLDRNRPLWEMHVIEGLTDGRVAVYSKVHHALLDGVSAIRWMVRGLSVDPEQRDMAPPWAPPDHHPPPTSPPAGPGDTAIGLAREAIEGGRAVGRAGVAAARTVARAVEDRAAALPYQAPRSMLNAPITGARRFAAQSWDLDRVRVVASELEGSINDVVLAMSAGALRRHLLDHDALPDEPLIAAVPVSLRGDADTDTRAGGNALGAVLCNLGTHLEDPLARFELIHRSMRDSKARLEGIGSWGVLLLSALSFGPVALGPLFRYEALARPGFNVIISNVPGPSSTLYWNGARMEGIYPVSVPYDGQALNITVTSYADSLEFGLIGCRRRVPHLQRLLDHLEDAISELERA